MPTCGSVFSGAGLLDAGLAMAGFEHAWVCESDEFRRGLLASRFPGAVVYDDIRTLRGQAAADTERDARELRGGPGELAGAADDPQGEGDQRQRGGLAAGDSSPRARRVDLIAGGFPCRGVSSAGKQNGFEHAETVLWFEMRRVIRELRPRYVVIENVAAILGMAATPGELAGSLWGTVLGDLAALGFGDIRWDVLPAAAVGAPHLRERVFCVAAHSACIAERVAQHEADAVAGGGNARPVSRDRGAEPAVAADAGSLGRERRADQQGEGWPPTERREASGHVVDRDPSPARGVAVQWGDYQLAITRWEAIHGPAPEPLVRRVDDGLPDVRRMRARMDRHEMRTQRQRLSALGDGVHVYCAHLVGLAIRHHMQHGEWG